MNYKCSQRPKNSSNLRLTQREFEFPRSQYTMIPTQEKMSIIEDNTNCDLGNFSMLVANVVNNVDVLESLNEMKKISSSDQFNPNEVVFIPEFIQKMVELVNSEGELANSTIHLLINFWYIQTYSPLLIDPNLIGSVFQKCFSPDLDTARLALSAIANVGSYFPMLFQPFLDQNFMLFLSNVLSNSTPYGIINPTIRFVLSLVRSDVSDVFDQFLHNFIEILSNPISRIVSFDAKIISHLIQKDSNFQNSIEFNLPESLLRAFQTTDSTQHLALYESILLFIQHEYTDYFANDVFIRILNDDYNQYFTTPAYIFFEVMKSLMSLMWNQFYDFGLISVIIDSIDLIEYNNKEYVAETLIKFFDFCDINTLANVGNEPNCLLFLCDIIPCLSVDSIIGLLKHFHRLFLLDSSIIEPYQENIIASIQQIQSQDISESDRENIEIIYQQLTTQHEEDEN